MPDRRVAPLQKPCYRSHGESGAKQCGSLRGYLRNVDFFETIGHRGFYKAVGVGGSINMVIVVPKGARGAFAEPFSHYTDNSKFDFEGQIWEGASVETIEREFEWIGQRGSRFKVLKVDGSTIYLQMIGQLR